MSDEERQLENCIGDPEPIQFDRSDHKLPICRILAIQFKVECGHCHATNFFTDRSPQDETKADNDGMKCYACGKRSFFDTAILLRQALGQTLDERAFHVEDGEPKAEKDF